MAFQRQALTLYNFISNSTFLLVTIYSNMQYSNWGVINPERTYRDPTSSQIPLENTVSHIVPRTVPYISYR